MSKDNYLMLKRLDARLTQLEDFCHELSNYIAEMQQESKDRHDKLVDEVNVFMHKTIAKIERMESNEVRDEDEERSQESIR